MIRPKKSLGQHFLTDHVARRAIITAAEIKTGDTILEIGPGEGFLTLALLETGASIIAVEKDDRLIGSLTEKFEKEIFEKRLTLIHADILDFLKTEITKLKAGYKLVANIPYYLTGQIIRRFLTTINQPQMMILMLQKEVAIRILAKDKKESILSLSVKVYGTPHYIRSVPRGAFRPAPGVDSAIVSINEISRNNFREISEGDFFELLKRGFAGKRKKLAPKLGLTAMTLAVCRIHPNARAEDLALDEWLCLARHQIR